MIIGTAGHIDHGKTTLVRALTGTNTDRLKQEQERGISIELGYAYLPLPDGQVLGIIDVPGHEKFIPTMAAGAVGIDHALLVVAADDGVMPQTLEHVQILQLLGIRSASVAITKADCVPPERIAEVQDEVAAILGVTAMAGAPLFPTAAARPDDPGTYALRQHLMQLAQHCAARSSSGLFRLAVDRAFSLTGQGTIVTGTVFGGQVGVGDSLTHSGTGRSVRVRSLHAQNRASPTGSAGQRVALNLAGIDTGDIARGDWLAQPQLLAASTRLDVRLHWLAENTPLTGWTAVHLHLGTRHCTGHVLPLSDGPLLPGHEGYAQLVLDAPAYALPGDRVIVRNAQASRTLAGAMVLDPDAPARKRRSAQRQAAWQALEHWLAVGDTAPLLAQARFGLPLSQLQRLCGHRQPPVPGDLQRIPLPQGDTLLLHPDIWQALQDQLLTALEQFHQQQPDEPGAHNARLQRMVWPGAAHTASQHQALWQALAAQLIASGQLQAEGAWLRLPSHRVQLTDQETALAESLLPRIAAGRFDPPWVRDLAQDAGQKEELVRQLLRKLARQGLVFQVVKDLFYARQHMDALAALIAELATQHAQGQVVARQFRDATGLGRKRAIQIMECFNRLGLTRRVGDAHVLRPGAQWHGQDAGR
ncbi:selenocysteine-specific translation elongation factor [Comamonas nitrativorans]|uniref:Selenocysteine-specific elongation factor n=1 Tax=Comamonas nitrativorans TaxID=108437 RepID=A0ABV9GYC8_9BURK